MRFLAGQQLCLGPVLFSSGSFRAGSGWEQRVCPFTCFSLHSTWPVSFCFRNVVVLDVIFNSATHPPRFWLGMWLAGGSFEWRWLILVFMFAIGIAASRRFVDLNNAAWKSPRSLPKYSRNRLFAIKFVAFAAIVLLWIVSRPSSQIPYVVTVCAYIVCVAGIEFIPRIRTLFEKIWLR